MVTQVEGCYADIYDWGNLYLAYRKAALGKRGHGPAARFEFRLEDNLVDLQDQLAAETYRPGDYVNFTIHEPKRRLINRNNPDNRNNNRGFRVLSHGFPLGDAYLGVPSASILRRLRLTQRGRRPVQSVPGRAIYVDVT